MRSRPATNDGCDTAGQKIDFPMTHADRIASGVPRLSIEERYPTHESCVAAVTTAVDALHQQCLLLDADARAYIDTAQSSTIRN